MNIIKRLDLDREDISLIGFVVVGIAAIVMSFVGACLILGAN